MRQAEPPEFFSRAALLFDLLVGVVQRYEPEVAAVLREERTTAGMSAVKLARTLQAQGIWFQLLAIAEQNRDMRSRREIERERGYEQLRGTLPAYWPRPRPRESPPPRSDRRSRGCACGR